MMKVLIGYDGSECADAALDDLNQSGLPQNGEAHIFLSLKCGFRHRRLRLTRSSKTLDMPTRPPNYGEILQRTVRQRRRHYLLPNALAIACRPTFRTGRSEERRVGKE